MNPIDIVEPDNLFCEPNLFELAMTNSRYLGVAIICSAMGMVTVSFWPLLVCYSFLFISQSTRSFQIVSTTVAVLSLGPAMTVDVLAGMPPSLLGGSLPSL